MKFLHKSLVASLVLCAGALTVWTAAAGRPQVTAPVEPPAAPSAGVSEEALRAAMTGVDVAAADLAPPAASEGESVATPADLKVTVRDSKQGRVIRVRRQGHLIALRRGAERKVAMHEITLPMDAAGAEITWESTSDKTLELLRGRVIVAADGSATLGNTVRSAVVSEEARTSHKCQGHADGEGGFVVLCRVDGPAAATSVDGTDPRQGVWSLAGEGTLVRLDLPMKGDGASAKVLGYEKGGRGVLVRVEASRVPGEIEAVLALGSDSRSQPEPLRPRGCFCHLPVRDGLL